jgi:hypothetical protein
VVLISYLQFWQIYEMAKNAKIIAAYKNCDNPFLMTIPAKLIESK